MKFVILPIISLIISGCANNNNNYKFNGFIIPLYLYPTSPEYTKLENLNFNRNIFIILNPQNGPGSNLDFNYYSKITNLKSKGFKILGYVYTSYGNRFISNIFNDINNWYNYYTIDGIFLDEVIGNLENLDFYIQCVNFIKNINNNLKVIFNPGTFPISNYLDLADINIVAEIPQDRFLYEWSKPYETPDYSLGILIYNVSDYNYNKVIEKAISEKINYIYITHEQTNNWNEISKYIQIIINDY